MILEWLPGAFSICKLADVNQADLSRPFTFLSRTDEEISLVCPSLCVPSIVIREEGGYAGLRIRGPLDFSLVGILSGIAACLSREEIPIFALSTYDTDYLLLPLSMAEKAYQAFLNAGYQLLPPSFTGV